MHLFSYWMFPLPVWLVSKTRVAGALVAFLVVLATDDEQCISSAMGAAGSVDADSTIKNANADDLQKALQELDEPTRQKVRAALTGGGGSAKSGPAKGKGDMDTVVLRHSNGATAEIYLFGGTLTSYKTADGKEKIFVSPGAIFDGKKAIRGGVPLVFPQFGQPDKAMAQHGFARSSVWTVKEIADSEEVAKLVLTLSDSADTRAKWPHAFALEYTVELKADHLTMTLKINNTGDAAFKFHALLHTYFMISDCAETAVLDLTGRSYIDKVAGGETKEETETEIILPSFTDRVYVGTSSGAQSARIAGKGGGAEMFATTQAASIDEKDIPVDVVVWNPYEEASPGDLPPPAFKNFVCVEPGIVSDFKELGPNGSAKLYQTIFAK
eukprot:TRINITY_DN595_c0_g1_i1.p1 TRINITY_DN595_c0_g1~~TRINITY_DN595_c0_g1_i1.p1  ORF type:complete len:383 (-),score=68.28 TRINITY_DN595_c0_g1_i1:144-1292(-)